jgi:beta-1,4-N-acetylglucosaminyltransferase
MFPFDRLIQFMDELVESGEIMEPVVGQIGQGKYEPRQFPFHRYLEKASFDETLFNCSFAVSHAGIGTISTAVGMDKRLIVLPRLKRYSEHVNDHQVWAARKYAESGQVMAVYSREDLSAAIRGIDHFIPKPRQANPHGIVDTIVKFIADCEERRR